MEETIQNIDPSLEYRRRLKPSSVLVYEVQKDGEVYVLKLARANNKWGIDHLDRECEVLTLAKDVPGLTHLIQTYKDVEGYKNPLLKEFYEGQTLKELDGRIEDTDTQRILENTVRNLHSLGVARLDLGGTSNIVLSPDKKDVCLIDLGYGVLSRDVNSSEFERMKSHDFHNLESYIFE